LGGCDFDAILAVTLDTVERLFGLTGHPGFGVWTAVLWRIAAVRSFD
jgi:hypothetical protein